MTPTNPFFFGPKITDPQYFVGRADAIDFIIQRMNGAQINSVNVYGERRIGKSSLLYHIYQNYAQYIEDSRRYLLIDINLQDARVRSKANLVRALRTEFHKTFIRYCQQSKTDIDVAGALWIDTNDTLAELTDQLQLLNNAGFRLIICLDEFEELLKDEFEFDNHFYDGLRYWMDNQIVMLIIASKKAIQTYRDEYGYTSKFFNVVNAEKLEKFSDEEAGKLLSHKVKGAENTHLLGVQDRKLALSLGGNHPEQLQIAAYYTCQAMIKGKDEAWVRHRVKQQRAVSQSKWQRKLYQIWHCFGYIPFLHSFVALIGERFDGLKSWFGGLMVLIVIIQLFTGVLPLHEMWNWLFSQLGFGGGTP